ncbi:MAG: OB-fold nucleic acid binding domain-containing protein [archaeon]
MAKNPAARLPLIEIVRGKIEETAEKYEPFRLVSRSGIIAGKVMAWGVVVHRYESENKKFCELTLDDFTETISVRAFLEKVEMLSGFSVGDIVRVLGKPREKDNEIFLVPDSIKRISVQEELVQRLENAMSLMQANRKRESEKIEKSKEKKTRGKKVEVEKNFVE